MSTRGPNREAKSVPAEPTECISSECTRENPCQYCVEYNACMECGKVVPPEERELDCWKKGYICFRCSDECETCGKQCAEALVEAGNIWVDPKIIPDEKCAMCWTCECPFCEDNEYNSPHDEVCGNLIATRGSCPRCENRCNDCCADTCY